MLQMFFLSVTKTFNNTFVFQIMKKMFYSQPALNKCEDSLKFSSIPTTGKKEHTLKKGNN